MPTPIVAQRKDMKLPYADSMSAYCLVAKKKIKYNGIVYAFGGAKKHQTLNY